MNIKTIIKEEVNKFIINENDYPKIGKISTDDLDTGKDIELNISTKDLDKRMVHFSTIAKKFKTYHELRGKKITWREYKKIPKNYLFTLDDDSQIFDVDGKYIRDNIDTDYTIGGHGYVYPNYIPENVIFIEKSSEDKTDTIADLYHEICEHYQMKYHGLIYEEAHDIATRGERKIRDRVNKGKKFTIKELEELAYGKKKW